MPNAGTCDSGKFVEGYTAHRAKAVPIDGVLVEDDEGWAYYVGANFGCVHWSKK